MYLPLASGTVLFQWGKVTIASTDVAIVFNITFPTACDGINVTPTALDASKEGYWVTSVSTTGCVVNTGASAAATIYWFAWGH